jgi:epoxyqueuosine reductase
MHSKSKYTQFIKSEAKRLSFCLAISKARFLEEEAPRLENWLKESEWANVFMESHFDKRLNPTLLVEDAKV